MERPLLNDQSEYPTDDVLARHLGKAKPAWDAFTARLAEQVPDAALEWRFYADGKAWLGKVVRKKKTVAWVSVGDRVFNLTFYFTAKNDDDIAGLPIDAALERAYRTRASAGKLKPLTIPVRLRKNLDDVFTVVEYKLGTK